MKNLVVSYPAFKPLAFLRLLGTNWNQRSFRVVSAACPTDNRESSAPRRPRYQFSLDRRVIEPVSIACGNGEIICGAIRQV